MAVVKPCPPSFARPSAVFDPPSSPRAVCELGSTPRPQASRLAPTVKIAPYRDSIDANNPASISTSAFEDM